MAHSFLIDLDVTAAQEVQNQKEIYALIIMYEKLNGNVGRSAISCLLQCHNLVFLEEDTLLD